MPGFAYASLSDADAANGAATHSAARGMECSRSTSTGRGRQAGAVPTTARDLCGRDTYISREASA